MPVKIAMTLLVRNEADIIEDVIRAHAALGVDVFIVMDNLSSDDTAAIVQALGREYEIDYLFQPQDDYSQAEWVTEMARRAATHHAADWVINNDADEFWLPRGGDLKQLFAGVPRDVAALSVGRHNAAVIIEGGDPLSARAHPRDSVLFERDSVNALGKPLPGKCAHRASPEVRVTQGNHDIAGLNGATQPAGDSMSILHFPYRTLDHYKQKIRLGGAAYARNDKLPKCVGATWRAHYDKSDGAGLDAFWAELALTREEADIGFFAGRLFEEHRLRDLVSGPDRQPEAQRLQRAAEDLLHTGQTMSRDLMLSQSHLIDRVPRPERKNRPLYYNLKFCTNGPRRHVERLERLCDGATPQKLCRDFSQLRDIYSLFPANSGFNGFLGELLSLTYPEAADRLRRDCDGKTVILHLSCLPRMARSRDSIASFASLGPGYHHIMVTGCVPGTDEDHTPLTLDYDRGHLRVPVPDNYESLHRKVFYAVMLVHLVAEPDWLVKLDDNSRLNDADTFRQTLCRVAENGAPYAGRRVGAAKHHTQWHGWHISKCADPEIEEKGYQYPLPQNYAAGGYGYVLGRDGMAACAYMYLAMKAFFAMRAVGLEDAYVGHAIYAKGLSLFDVSSDEHRLALPGLTTSERLAAETPKGHG
ncbi:glycosyl transferase family 2 [Rhodovulum bhavnagarense]|uniref:Glycosyl transferase family 2 n=1 Tax=Rhodovulum bhavnagarense TaxID=992286 RepID=A0A4R2R608_9RHOB|nr:glycosyltransferase family 2 protein [Rhodovulum bhavnagarense]TCP58450.1 glycosyl transferase family 2 [Rhodovulum bhavnagarense]